jgi:hypothetical protein
MQDFEVLVVGDGCTDDSEGVVAAFCDPRVRWHNLEKNYGSQWFANNYGCENAAADWIAYLGHDDIWYPTHLEAILRTAREESAEIVTSTMILYWPESTGGRGIAGVFPTGKFGAHDFVPPSAFAHAKWIYGNTVFWRDHTTTAAPIDAAFLDDLARTGHKLASTGELTCFKFNAAWRRDAYQTKPIDEQLRMLQRIESGKDFRQSELIAVLQSVVAGRFLWVASPPTAGIEPGSFARRNRRSKGLDSRFDPGELRRVEQTMRFDLARQEMPFEWHSLEEHPVHGTFRWTGPSTQATIDLPIVFDRDLALRIHVVYAISKIDGVTLSIHGQAISHRVEPLDDGTFLIHAQIKHALARCTRDFGITLDRAETSRPIDLGRSEDPRWLGIAVNWIELSPLPERGA